ncbi:MAG: hypothetical protein ABJZ55_08695 [Fuerstiella sp.]
MIAQLPVSKQRSDPLANKKRVSEKESLTRWSVVQLQQQPEMAPAEFF